MQKQYFQFLICSLFLIVGLSSCEDQTKTPAESDEKNTEVTDRPVGDPIFGQITAAEAIARASKYNAIYGAKHRYLVQGQDSFLLPRYFTVNSDTFRELLNDEDGVIFASLGVKNRKDQPNLPDTAVANLIFHGHRPQPNGLLGDKDIKFFDNNTACPIDCGNSYNHGGYNGAPVNPTEAKERVVRYNNIYGRNLRYIKSQDDESAERLLLARYYSFNVNDIDFLLERLESSKHQFFSVTIGAQPEMKNDQPVPGSYVSDLIFHMGRPSETGSLSGIKFDFFDVTQPCPNICPKITDL